MPGFPTHDSTTETIINKKRKSVFWKWKANFLPILALPPMSRGCPKRKFLHLPSSQDTLMNCPQACFFYALDAFFRTHGICPDPVITRNTNFSKKEELAAFFEHFLKHTADYPCHYKKVKDVSFPDNSVIVIVNGYNEIIHAVFYHDGLFHTKNGLLSPFVYSTIRPILKGYGSKDNPGKDLSKTGKLMLGQTLKVYTLNDSLYHLHQ